MGVGVDVGVIEGAEVHAANAITIAINARDSTGTIIDFALTFFISFFPLPSFAVTSRFLFGRHNLGN